MFISLNDRKMMEMTTMTSFSLILYFSVLAIVHGKQFVVRQESFEGTIQEMTDRAVELAEKGYR